MYKFCCFLSINWMASDPSFWIEFFKALRHWYSCGRSCTRAADVACPQLRVATAHGPWWPLILWVNRCKRSRGDDWWASPIRNCWIRHTNRHVHVLIVVAHNGVGISSMRFEQINKNITPVCRNSYSILATHKPWFQGDNFSMVDEDRKQTSQENSLVPNLKPFPVRFGLLHGPYISGLIL